MRKKKLAMTAAPPLRTADEGFALAMIVSIVTIMFIMLAAMMLPLTVDITSAQRIRNITSARQLGESVLNQLYTQAAKSSDLSDGFRMIGRVDPGHQVDWAGPTAGWAQYDAGSGKFGTCVNITDSCFYYSPQIVAGSPFVNVEVTTRQACTATGRNCVLRRFQQQWRRRTFVDYVMFTDLETLQPDLYGAGLTVVRNGVSTTRDTAWATTHCAARTDAGHLRNGLTDLSRRQTEDGGSVLGHYLWPHRVDNDPAKAYDEAAVTQPADRRHEDCFEIAYTGSAAGDTVNGPIHTNDYWFWYCGTPRFLDAVEAGGDPALTASAAAAAIFKVSRQAGCTSGGFPTDGAGAAITTQAGRGNYLQLPTQISAPVISKLAAVTLTPVALATPVSVTLTGKTMSVITGSGSVIMDVPYRGLVYVPGDLRISGEANDVTFVASGNLTITGNITQAPGTRGVTLGFVAGGSTTIQQDTTGADRSIAGAFLSLTGGMLVDGWNDSAAAALLTHPTLHLKGAVIAKYRPVFGTYNATGDLQTGMHKDINYPTDAAGNKLPPTPPYFLEPVNAVWVRLDLAETPIQAGRPGLTSRPADGIVVPANLPTNNGICTKTWPPVQVPADPNKPVPPANYVPLCLVLPIP
jgi:hypothetical protein